MRPPFPTQPYTGLGSGGGCVALGSLGDDVPGAGVGEGAAADALAGAAEVLGQVLGGDVLGELLLVVFAEDVDLLLGSLVEPGLDERPDGGEEVRSVDDEHVAHGLGVVVLANGGRGRHIVLDWCWVSNGLVCPRGTLPL